MPWSLYLKWRGAVLYALARHTYTNHFFYITLIYTQSQNEIKLRNKKKQKDYDRNKF